MADAIVRQIPQAMAIQDFSPDQKDLIKRTVAKDATDDELSMFLHIARQSGLDPLRRQIHFLKMQGRVVTIADVNGLQARAAREADYEGILHAPVYEKDDFLLDNVTGQVVRHTTNPLGANGALIGAWAIVKRRGMQPFVSVVRFREYDASSRNPIWKSMPAMMIDKCAKSTALRLAYPEQLGSIYEPAELDNADEREVNPPPPIPTENGKRTTDVKAQLAAKAATLTSGNTPAQRAVFLLIKAGKTGAEAVAFVKSVTGKVKREDLTDEDTVKLQDALALIESEKQPADPEPPPQEEQF